MTLLQIMSDDGSTVLVRSTDAEQIAGELAPLGVGFARWRQWPLLSGAGPEEVRAAYHPEIDLLCAMGGYRLVDVVSLCRDPADPEWTDKAGKARQAFLDEHVHDEDEVRFFAAGRGCFYLHLDSQVYAVVCEAGDLLSVPAGTRHWFDMGSEPNFCVIRLFQNEEGWVAEFTGDPVARSIPRLDELLVAV